MSENKHIKEQSTFEKLSQINVNKNTEKKGKFTYLSWSFAWSELKKVAPNSTVKVYHDKNTNMPYFESKAGVIVKAGVTVDGLEHISYLPVMDFSNKAIKPDAVEMMGVNKAIQRCITKAIALHGLGLYIYAGEDLPEEPRKEKLTEKEIEVISKKIKDCKDITQLGVIYNSDIRIKTHTVLKPLFSERRKEIENN